MVRSERAGPVRLPGEKRATPKGQVSLRKETRVRPGDLARPEDQDGVCRNIAPGLLHKVNLNLLLELMAVLTSDYEKSLSPQKNGKNGNNEPLCALYPNL